jgi:phosphoglycolate phosphatase-like HAD superfamily hydrolase
VRLFLFDIDGTLLTAHGAGRRALTSAMVATYGTAGDVDRYDFRGKTDPRIVRDLVTGAGVPGSQVDARLAGCFETYVHDLQALLRNGHRVDAMPGVAELLARLSRRADILLGLLTGNIQAGARAKLHAAGLLGFFRLGAYGSDHEERRRLPAIACQRARAAVGEEFPLERTVIVGDTPLDIDCAQACGARAVAVATGQHSAEELRACTPHLLLDDLSDVPAVLARLTEL